MLSCIWLFVTPWTVARQTPLSMEVSRQEYWSGLPFPSPGDQTCVLCISCTGRWILYHCTTWEPWTHTEMALSTILWSWYLVKPGLRSPKSIISQLHSLHLFPYSFIQHILSSTYYVPGNVLGSEDTAISKTGKNLCPHGTCGGETTIYRILGSNKN